MPWNATRIELPLPQVAGISAKNGLDRGRACAFGEAPAGTGKGIDLVHGATLAG